MLVKEKPMTYAQLERKINTGYRTIKANCEELEKLGHLEVKRVDEHPDNGQPSYFISLSEEERKRKKGKS